MRLTIFNPRNRGFTIIELIVVIVMIGILAVTAMPRFSGKHGFEERNFRDEVATALRYGQKSAIAARRTVCATFSPSVSPTQLSFRISTSNGATNCTVGAPLKGVDGKDLILQAPTSTTFSDAPASLYFEASGRPDAKATIAVSGLSAAQTITIEAETGYVH